MAIHDLSSWQHNHVYDPGNAAGERRTWIVVAITAATMVAEIVAGIVTGSMALLADGWHMATHVVALSIAGVAYWLARRWSRDERFAFGTWKIEVLGAFTSALLLAVVALAMIVESLHRLVDPAPINFVPALIVAAIGLGVNLASAMVLAGAGHGHAHLDRGHAHDHDSHHGHDHHHQGHDDRPLTGDHHPAHDLDRTGEYSYSGERPQARQQRETRSVTTVAASHDLNLRSAYMHVLADAFTSFLAIAALAAGLWLGWAWLDPVMGIVGAAVIAWWSKGLLGDSARVLLDREMDAPLVVRIRAAVESDGDAEIADLHVWRVGRASHAAVLSIVAREPFTPAVYRRRLAGIPTLMHVSVEVNRCAHDDCP